MQESLAAAHAQLKDNPSGRGLNGADLVSRLVSVSALYGASLDGTLIPYLQSHYATALSQLMPDRRRELWQQLAELVARDDTGPAALLPIVICDTDEGLVSTATLDLLAYSRITDLGLPYGLIELVSLIDSNALANKGAAFGGAVAFADRRLRSSLDIMQANLNEREIQVAARIQTGLPSHTALDFWLGFAEQAVDRTDPISLSKLGSAASAIALTRLRASGDLVVDAERVFPAHHTDEPVRFLRTWSLDDYAAEIAPRLYGLEARERAPRVFAVVLETWGLNPLSPVEERAVRPGEVDLAQGRDAPK